MGWTRIAIRHVIVVAVLSDKFRSRKFLLPNPPFCQSMRASDKRSKDSILLWRELSVGVSKHSTTIIPSYP